MAGNPMPAASCGTATFYNPSAWERRVPGPANSGELAARSLPGCPIDGAYALTVSKLCTCLTPPVFVAISPAARFAAAV